MNTPCFFKICIGITILSLLLGACSPSASVSIAKSDPGRETSPATSSENIQVLVRNNNEFAFDLYQPLQTRDENLIYSPDSISLAPAMTYAGARAETESQMVNPFQ